MTSDSCQKEVKYFYLEALPIEIHADTQKGLLKKKNAIRQINTKSIHGINGPLIAFFFT